MSADTKTRRRFLQATGVAATLAIAGCTGGGGGDENGGGNDTTTSESGGEETTTSGGEETTTSGGVPEEVSEWLSDTSDFDGTVADKTGSSTVSVNVGASGNGGNFAFAPPAVRIESGTTVKFEWTGKGGAHNVVAKSGSFDSGDPVGESGVNFKHTFEESGIHLYYCEPHKSLGMKGAVIVE